MRLKFVILVVYSITLTLWWLKLWICQKNMYVNHLKVRCKCSNIWNFTWNVLILKWRWKNVEIVYCFVGMEILCSCVTLDTFNTFYRCTYEYDLFKWIRLSVCIKLKKNHTRLVFNLNWFEVGRTYTHKHTNTYDGLTYGWYWTFRFNSC